MFTYIVLHREFCVWIIVQLNLTGIGYSETGCYLSVHCVSLRLMTRWSVCAAVAFCLFVTVEFVCMIVWKWSCLIYIVEGRSLLLPGPKWSVFKVSFRSHSRSCWRLSHTSVYGLFSFFCSLVLATPLFCYTTM